VAIVPCKKDFTPVGEDDFVDDPKSQVRDPTTLKPQNKGF